MLKHWLLATRPKTLLAGFAPVAIGTSLAIRDGGAHWGAALAALAGALCIQIGTNFCNDYFDFLQGADTGARKGPTRAVQAGWIVPRAMIVASGIMFGLLGLICVWLFQRAGWPVLVIGIVSTVFGILYTAGRYSLAYLGLADPFVLIFFGPVAVAGTCYVQTRAFSPAAVVAGLAPGLIAVGLLVVNNLRDVTEDRIAGKRTLAVRFGVRWVRWEYTLGLLVASLIPVVLWMGFDFAPRVAIASSILLPGCLLVRKVWTLEGAALNPCLGMTAGLLLLYTILFCLAVVSSVRSDTGARPDTLVIATQPTGCEERNGLVRLRHPPTSATCSCLHA